MPLCARMRYSHTEAATLARDTVDLFVQELMALTRNSRLSKSSRHPLCSANCGTSEKTWRHLGKWSSDRQRAAQLRPWVAFIAPVILQTAGGSGQYNDAVRVSGVFIISLRCYSTLSQDADPLPFPFWMPYFLRTYWRRELSTPSVNRIPACKVRWRIAATA